MLRQRLGVAKFIFFGRAKRNSYFATGFEEGINDAVGHYFLTFLSLRWMPST